MIAARVVRRHVRGNSPRFARLSHTLRTHPESRLRLRPFHSTQNASTQSRSRQYLYRLLAARLISLYVRQATNALFPRHLSHSRGTSILQIVGRARQEVATPDTGHRARATFRVEDLECILDRDYLGYLGSGGVSTSTSASKPGGTRGSRSTPASSVAFRTSLISSSDSLIPAASIFSFRYCPRRSGQC